MGVNFISLSSCGEGISGGDRIYIELAREWSKEDKVIISLFPDGRKMCERNGLNKSHNINYEVLESNFLSKFRGFINYFLRIPYSIVFGFRKSIENPSVTIIYSSSDFLMDVIPGFILKLRYPKLKWVATWYQTAPNPIKGFAEGSRENTYKLSAFYYWFQQLLTKPMIRLRADKILVNNEDERKRFDRQDKVGKVGVIIGAVRLDQIDRYIEAHPNQNKIYDAVFQGRFHPQKGVVELVEIWSKVVKTNPNAKLAMIGDGPLMSKTKSKIKKLRLEKNINLLGYVFDGDKKYKIFSQSKLVVHPALYDSGGMASAEAMAFSLPCIGFDLVAYKSYYPKGMRKVETGNLEKYSDAIIELLENKTIYNKYKLESRQLIENNWSWKGRSTQILNFIQK